MYMLLGQPRNFICYVKMGPVLCGKDRIRQTNLTSKANNLPNDFGI